MQRQSVKVRHSKLLAETQFAGMQGSPQHAAMTMNRVWIDFRVRNYDEYTRQTSFVVEHLLKVARNYFFIGSPSKNDDRSMRVYFLSKQDAEEFAVWAAAALPVNDEEAR
jgi:hypothetical protein